MSNLFKFSSMYSGKTLSLANNIYNKNDLEWFKKLFEPEDNLRSNIKILEKAKIKEECSDLLDLYFKDPEKTDKWMKRKRVVFEKMNAFDFIEKTGKGNFVLTCIKNMIRAKKKSK